MAFYLPSALLTLATLAELRCGLVCRFVASRCCYWLVAHPLDVSYHFLHKHNLRRHPTRVSVCQRLHSFCFLLSVFREMNGTQALIDHGTAVRLKPAGGPLSRERVQVCQTVALVRTAPLYCCLQWVDTSSFLPHRPIITFSIPVLLV